MNHDQSKTGFLLVLILCTGISMIRGPCARAFEFSQTKGRHPSGRSVPPAPAATRTRTLDECDQVLVTFRDTVKEEISPYYRRDRRDVNNTRLLVEGDLQSLQNLLSERYHARRRKKEEPGHNKSKVAEIEQQLLNRHGVRVYDTPRIWTTILDDPPDWQLRKQERRRNRELKRIFGPRGHPYNWNDPSGVIMMDPLSCSLEVPTIHQLLSRRAQLTMDGHDEEADAVKFELWIHGIRVSEDKSSEWTTNLPVFATEAESSFINDDQTQQQCPTSTSMDKRHRTTIDTNNLNEYGYVEDAVRSIGFHAGDLRSRKRVEQIITVRTEALVCGDVCTPLYLDLELCRTYRVLVDDKRRVWFVTTASSAKDVDKELVRSVQENFALSKQKEHESAPFLPIVTLPRTKTVSDSVMYRQSGSSCRLLEDWFQHRVESLVLERALKREEGKFLEADAIRRELRQTYDIGISDRLRQYGVGGVFCKD